MDRQSNKKQSRIWLAVSVFSVWGYLLILSLRYDFWYDLNDDVMIKNITSGLYTGTPESHNIQMQYPLSLFLSFLYLLTNRIPWYALFLVGVQVLSIFLILFRTSEMFPETKTRIAGFSTMAAILFWLLTKHMVIYQYTVSCAFLSGAAAFLLLTGRQADETGSKKGGRILNLNNIMVVILLLLSFLIRSEMMLLTFPIVMVVLLFCLIFTYCSDVGIEDKPHILRAFKKYLALFITLVIVIALSVVINRGGYSSAEWKTFNEFFDARTELYDFNALPPYNGNEAFYQKIGMDETSQKLLENYNFGLDEEMDAKLLTEIAAYSKEQKKAVTGSFSDRIKFAFSSYLYRISHPLSADEDETDVFWKMTLMVIYLLVLLTGFRHHILWKLALLFTCRTTLWLYIIYRNRAPVRITHSLYFVELMALAGLFVLEAGRFLQAEKQSEAKRKKKNIITSAISITVVLLFFISIPKQDRFCKQEEELRQGYSKPYDILFAYMEEHPDRFYFMDVYSWVEYTERLFGNTHFNNESYRNKQVFLGMNYDIMGGWATFSPAAESKIRALGTNSMREALLMNYVYYVQKAKGDLNWLESYYQNTGYDIVIELSDTVGDFMIYRLEHKKMEHN